MAGDNTHTTAIASDRINCSDCGQQIDIYDKKGSEYFGCGHCGYYFHYTATGGKKQIEKFPKPVTIGNNQFETQLRHPLVPLGTTCIVDSKEYTITGFLIKEQKDEAERWKEYLLFNPAEAYYATLVEFNGHWTLVTYAQNQDYKNTYNKVVTPDMTYSRYVSYRFEIIQATGEFDWNVVDDEQVQVTEYVAPPYMLVKEEHKKHKEWFEGVYLKRKDVAKLFNLPLRKLPLRQGYSPVQPYDANGTYKTVMTFSVFMLLAVLLINLVIHQLKPERELVSFHVSQYIDSVGWGGGKMTVSDPFIVKGPASLEIDIKTSLYNDWIELPMTLVNETTGETYAFTKALEYYQGYDSDGGWSEGDREGEVILSHMPSGTYRLNVEMYAETNSNKNINISVTQNAWLTSNILIMILIIAAYPVYLYSRRYTMRQSVWANSSYYP